MTHTPLPRTLASATGDVQAKIAQGHPGAAGPDPRKRIWTDLVRARRFFDLNKGDLALLQAMLWTLSRDERMVFAKNEHLSKKAGGMSHRSISRHLGKLEAAGFITSNRSPNCKRYKLRDHGQVLETYGFNLSPVFDRAAEFAARAKEADDQDAALAVLQNRLSKLRARLEAAGADPEFVDELRRARRWAFSPALPEMLAALERRALATLASIEPSRAMEPVVSRDPVEEPGPALAEAPAPSGDNHAVTPMCAEELTLKGSHSGRHYQSRNDRVFYAPTDREGPNAGPDEEQMTMRLGDGEVRHAMSSTRLMRTTTSDQEPEAPTLPEEPRLGVKDYVQSVLAGFRHKLRDETRPKLGALTPDADMTRPPHGQVSATATEASGCLRHRLRTDGAPWAGHGDLSELPSLDAVLEACPEGLSLAGERPQNWSQLFEAAWRLGGWIGIPPAILGKACARLGRNGLAVTLFGLCQRLASIREPAAYLQALCAKQGFHPGELLRSGREASCAG